MSATLEEPDSSFQHRLRRGLNAWSLTALALASAGLALSIVALFPGPVGRWAKDACVLVVLLASCGLLILALRAGGLTAQGD